MRFVFHYPETNGPGGDARDPFTGTTPKAWDALLRTNLLHVLHACSLAAPRMRDGGSIISLTTIEAHRAASGFAVYTAAKAAVEQFARTLAVELAPSGVRTAIPMGRLGQVTDVSHCVVFLASALSAYATGSTLHPDGGTYACSGWFNWPGSGWANHASADLLAERDTTR